MAKTLVFALSLLAAPAALAQAGPPAEPPPADFAGRQYIDSRGCVYLRAEVGGAVNWVPRLNAQREPICGFRPSQGETAELPPEPNLPSDAAAPASPTDPVAAAPAPPSPRPAAPRATAAAAAPRDPKSPDPAAVAAARPRTQPVRTAKPARQAPSQSAPVVVAGPSRTPGVSAGTRAAADGSPFYPVPRSAPLTVPPGYRKAWDDDRLNPHRGKQTLDGALHTALVWTQEVPRRLVDQSSGKDLTEELRYLVYPYTDYSKQLADLRAGTHVTVQNSRGERLVVRRSDIRVTAGGTTVHAVPRVSTKSAPVPAQAQPRIAAPKAIGPSYVNVGLFANEADAMRVATQLQRRGLPTRLAMYRNGASGQRLVMAGPFTEAGALNRALATVRGAGYSNARVR